MTAMDAASRPDAAGDGWADLELAAALFAVDPVGIGGVLLRAAPGVARDRWLNAVRTLLGPVATMRRIPLHTRDERLLGGLDLAATLRSGRPTFATGLLAEAHEGVVVLTMAERITDATAGRITAALDRGEIAVERDGLTRRSPARFGVIALDEGADPTERAPAGLRERLGIHLDLTHVDSRVAAAATLIAHRQVLRARARLPTVSGSPDMIAALCRGAASLGIGSARAPWLALRVACASAALDGRTQAAAEDAARATRLVLVPRATQVAAMDHTEAGEPEPPPEGPAEGSDDTSDDGSSSAQRLEDVVLAAAAATLPAELLARLQLAPDRSRTARTGRAAAHRSCRGHGRPVGSRPGDPTRGERLDILATLRAAAPLQRLRGRGRRSSTRIRVHRDDLRVVALKKQIRTTRIFLVDASGSAALHRLAEVKGAVELMLAECYIQRDQVALLAFRGQGAELLLPPTRSLTRAKRELAGLPGGGGTPLASALEAGRDLAQSLRRRGEVPLIILLTDGQPNIARDGRAGRAAAECDALTAARLLGAEGFAAVLIDTAPQPREFCPRLAAAMRARYLALPHADAAMLVQAVRTVASPAGARR
jgi:magnesium chelatase subunit D